MIVGLDHTAISAKNLEETVEFYNKVLRLPVQLRASKASLIILIAYFIGMFPSVFGFSTLTARLLQEGRVLTTYIDTVAAVSSGFTALVLVSTYTGLRSSNTNKDSF